MKKTGLIFIRQLVVCYKYGTRYSPAPGKFKLGIAKDFSHENYPINGLRTNPVKGTSGWYIWAGKGELSTDADYFEPLHVSHLAEICPEILKYLGLPPGWRFLVAPDYVDVWFDKKLTDIY